MSNPKSDPSQKARKLNFTEVLSTMHDGHFAKELDAAHAEVVEHIMNRSGKCSITVTLKYAQADDKGTGVLIGADIDVKKPKRSRRPSFTYADEKGQTFLDDPSQTEMELAESLVQFQPARAASE